MKTLFTLTELKSVNTCENVLARLMESSTGENVTLNDFEHCVTSDLLWCLKLLNISEHKQKVIAVKTAIFAARSVLHLTDDDHALVCVEAVETWVANPCDETQQVAAMATRMAAYADDADSTTRPKIKAHLIQLIEAELN